MHTNRPDLYELAQASLVLPGACWTRPRTSGGPRILDLLHRPPEEHVPPSERDRLATALARRLAR